MAAPRVVTADEVVQAFTKTRDEIKRMEKELEVKLAPLKTLQVLRGNWLTKEIAKTKLKNLPTKFGTAYVGKHENVSCADWDVFMNFVFFDRVKEVVDQFDELAPEVVAELMDMVRAAVQPEFLDHKINKTAALEHMGEDRSGTPVPGSNYSSVQKIGVKQS